LVVGTVIQLGENKKMYVCLSQKALSVTHGHGWVAVKLAVILDVSRYCCKMPL
jgi:hypothetical protein